ncbi:meprin A subunit beta-like isoform X3 [Rana temporaria]|uniref:meprin A subunit beta-like isoform X3 n=1 Tax=Rana temporaria TaxID=8407 RepID=UPI001AADC0FC|nr:meprin A subunit beta-like isoform X3 [Rana temporaria]
MGTMNFPLSLLLIAFHVVNGLFLPPFPDIPAKNCTFNLTQANILEINEASGLDLFEGDIVHDTKSRNTIIGSKYRWPLTVPYYLEDSLDINAKGVILKAFERFRLKTCIDFKPWSGEKNYISVFKGLGCYSLVGNQQAGKQLLSIGAGCDTVESVQHELLHALGFFHEQSRSDRDDYITVVWANIQSGKSSNFKLYDSSKATFLEVPYDYTSVMHYGKKAFSTGNVTMIPKNAKFDNIIGQQTDFSASDVLKLNRLYNCTSSGLFLDSCNFESDDVCGMLKSSGTGSNWQRVTQAPGGPSSDHTYMENRVGNFMHLSTRTGNAGYQSILESRLFYPVRKYQCLEFFYYNSGSKNDRLNIYIKQYLPDFPNGIYILVDTISVGGRYFMWDNPALVGWNKRFSNGTQYKMTGGSGAMLFTSKEWLDRNHFLKGGDAIILLSVEDISNLTRSQPSKFALSSLNSAPDLTMQSSSGEPLLCRQNICYNDGICVLENQIETCRCKTTGDVWYGGTRCENVLFSGAHVLTKPTYILLSTVLLVFTATLIYI